MKVIIQPRASDESFYDAPEWVVERGELVLIQPAETLNIAKQNELTDTIKIDKHVLKYIGYEERGEYSYPLFRELI